ncbi:thymidylate kinase (plasmid) [Streptosporangium sp. NBC_01495]|uniref:dTMP kinase n=1 Tax=Streptosporangium sp. NBC_01495 TaxID=2903899 RepID=UPI002E2FD8EF|nr:dTMP kinase [Streptosporangium sp. NBC_01495]
MLISLEGLPGSGKSTQAALLAAHLRASGQTVAHLPDLATLNTDPLGDVLFDLFSSCGDVFKRHGDVITDTHLAAAIRANITATLITPALGDHDTVIEDRGIHTMYSYSLASLLHNEPQDGVDGVEAVIAWLTTIGSLTGRQPDLAIWLRLPPPQAIRRAVARDARPFTVEQQTYLRHVDTAYRELAARDARLTILEIDISESPQSVHQRVCAAVHAASRSLLSDTETSCAPSGAP